MFLKVVELWLCFKTQKVCDSLNSKIYVKCNSFRNEKSASDPHTYVANIGFHDLSLEQDISLREGQISDR